MFEKLKTNKILIIIEIAILLLFVIAIIVRRQNNNTINVDLTTMSTDYEGTITYEGEFLKIDNVTGENYKDYDYLLYGPNAPLKNGSYTIVLNYVTQKPQTVVIESLESEEVIEGSQFFLSKNKNIAAYNFAVSNNINDFRIRLIDYPGGEFILTGMQIIKNNHDIRTLLFLYLAGVFLLNLYIFNDAINANRKTIILLVLIGLLASIPLCLKGVIFGHDLKFHLARIDGLAEGIRSGTLPVKMYPVYNDNYGYPVGIYYGDLLLYIPAIFRLIGFTTATSYKLFILLINIFTAFTSYFAGKGIFKTEKTAILFSMVFTLSTYRLLCIYVRAAVGEYSATCFYPIIMLAVWNIFTQNEKAKEYKRNAILLAVGMSGLIYNHVLSTQMVVIVLFVISIVLFKKTFRKETMLIYATAVALCIMLSAAFIVPFMEYYVRVDTLLDDSSFTSTYIQGYGAYISDYFAFFKDIFGYAKTDVVARMQITPGLVLMAGLFVGLYLWLNGNANKQMKAMIIGSVACLFVASNIFPWNMIYDIPKLGKFLVQVQFPLRYVGLAVCFMSILFGMVVESFDEQEISQKAIRRISTTACLIMTFVFVSSVENGAEQIYTYDTTDLKTYTDHGVYGLGAMEYLLDNSAESMDLYDYSVTSDGVEAALVNESGVKLTVNVDAKPASSIEIPRFAYLHFTARDEAGNKLKTVTGTNNRLQILFDDVYLGNVYVSFVEPWYWRVAEIVSLISLLIMLFTIISRSYSDAKDISY